MNIRTLLTLLSLLTVSWSSAITVTTSVDGDPGSLREILSVINSGEMIDFDTSLSGQTLTLTGGQLVIDKDVIIDASALPDGLTIDAGGQSRIFEILQGSIATFRSLTLTGGNEFHGVRSRSHE